MTPDQKLNLVLEDILKASNPDGSISEDINTLHAKYKALGISQRMLSEILIKLIKDGHLRADNYSTNTAKEITNYRVTFEGELFITAGGYVKASKDLKAKEEEKQDMQKRNEKSSSRLNILTAVLASGSIALAIIETMKFHFEYPCLSFIWFILVILSFSSIPLILVISSKTSKKKDKIQSKN